MTAAVTILRQALSPALGAEASFTVYFVSVFFSTLIAGLLAGVVAALVGGGIAIWLFVQPHGAWPTDLSSLLAGALFWLVAALLIGAVSALREALREAAASKERAALLSREMSHRVKNLLALTQALVTHSARTSTSAAELAEKLQERVVALAAAQDLALTADQEVRLTTLVTAALRPFSDERVLLDLPDDCDVHPDTARALLLAIHELATNALKYGALCSDSGQVAVRSSACDEDFVRLQWTESGGPEVTPPERTGFGSRLIRSALTDPRESVRLEFAPEGVRCVFTIRARVALARASST